MKFYKIILISHFLFTNLVLGQQEMGVTQNFTSSFLVNPSMAGYNSGIDIGLFHRNQWVGIPGAPVTSSILVDGPIKSEVNGVGAQFTTDQTGIFINTTVKAAYSHRFTLGRSKGINLLLGASLGMIDHKIDFSKAVVVNNNEPYLFQTAQRQTVFNGSLGATVVWRGFEAGLAAPLIGANKVRYKDNLNDANYLESRQFISHIKLPFLLSSKIGLSFIPYALLRVTPKAPVQYDLSGIIDYREKLWVAVTYKNDYAVAVSAGIRLYNVLTLGYSYDIILNSLKPYAGRSSEIVAIFTINKLAKAKEKLLVDSDFDGVPDEFDLEANTPAGTMVNFQGKSIIMPVALAGGTNGLNGKNGINPNDRDNDLVADSIDVELNTPAGLLVDRKGRRIAGGTTNSFDLDNDGVSDDVDVELNTRFGAKVDATGKRIIGADEDLDRDGVLDNIDEDLNTLPGVTVDKYGRQIGGIYDLDNDGVADTMDLDVRTLPGHEVDRLGQSITIIITPPIYETAFFFDVDKTTVKPGSEEKFVGVAKALKEHPDVRIVLSGHCDSKGSVAYNMNLGQRRAQAVANRLIKEYGISPNQISVVMSKGKSDPLSKSKQHVNRRVDVTVEKVKR